MPTFGPHKNEFDRTWLRWVDYFSLVIFNFPLIMLRRYDWPDKKNSTWVLAFLGITITIVGKKKNEYN